MCVLLWSLACALLRGVDTSADCRGTLQLDMLSQVLRPCFACLSDKATVPLTQTAMCFDKGGRVHLASSEIQLLPAESDIGPPDLV